MYAVGHIAIGYLTGKATGKLFRVNPNIPLIFVASVIPDVDILIPGLVHRGPTHSIILITLIFLPLFILYRGKVLPYFIAVTQHPLIGDYITGGTKLLYPLTENYYGLHVNVESRINIATEWTFFLLSTLVLIETKDLESLFRPHRTHMLLAIPLLSLLLPTLAKFPTYVPKELFIPHIAYILVCVVSILIDVKASVKNLRKHRPNTFLAHIAKKFT